MKTFLILVICGLSVSAQASFRQGYMSPQDLLMSLKMKFSQASTQFSCLGPNDEKLPIFGDINLQTGDPVAEVPAAGFLAVWKTCIDSYFQILGQLPNSGDDESDKNIRLGNQQIFEQVWIPEVFAPLLNEIDASARKSGLNRSQVLRSHLMIYPPEASRQKELVDHWVRWILGTDEEILSYARMQDVNRFRADLQKFLARPSQGTRTLLEVYQEAAFILFKRDEFLLY